MTLPIGIHHDIDDATYHADDLCAVPTLSSSLARTIINQSPLHAWTAHPRLNPDHEPTEKKTFDIGRAAHRAVLGRGGDYVAIPEDVLASNGAASTKAAKEFIEDARTSGLTPLKADEVDRIEAIADAVRARLAAMNIRLDPKCSEVTALAEVDGVMCRARFDNLPLDPRLPAYDFKTCEDASPEAVIRSVERYGYDVQAAHYLATLEAATGQRRKMRFIFVEKSAPFEVAVVELYNAPGAEGDWMVAAESKAAEARRIWAECLHSGEWPGYPRAVQIIGARGWEQARWEQRMADKPQAPTREALAASYAAQAPERMKA
jgi:hypothetical protein